LISLFPSELSNNITSRGLISSSTCGFVSTTTFFFFFSGFSGSNITISSTMNITPYKLSLHKGPFAIKIININ